MLRLLKYLLLFVLFLGAIGAAIVFSGNTLTVIGWLWGPKHGWDLAQKAPAPDYAQAASWAAWPGRESPAAFVPQGVAQVHRALGDVSRRGDRSADDERPRLRESSELAA